MPAREGAMLYAILCYHDEGVVGSWTQEQDDAVIAKRMVAPRSSQRRASSARLRD
jgi:hypothetical protein